MGAEVALHGGGAADEELVARVASGDGGALGELFERYHRDVYAFLCAMTTEVGPELDDMVQDTFLGVHRGARRFRGGSTVRSWLFGIAANVVRNHWRGALRRRRALGRMRLEAPQLAPAPDGHVHANRQLHRLYAALQELPRKQRAAYVMCVIEGVEPEEVSRVLGIARGSVWRRVHDARVRLRALLGEGEGES